MSFPPLATCWVLWYGVSQQVGGMARWRDGWMAGWLGGWVLRSGLDGALEACCRRFWAWYDIRDTVSVGVGAGSTETWRAGGLQLCWFRVFLGLAA